MRSRRVEALLLAACLAAVVPAGAQAPLTRDQVDERARELADLPGLRGAKVERQLKFKFDTPKEKPKPEDTPGWVLWLRDFFGWLNDSGRYLVWVVIALALGFGAVWLRRWWLGGGGRVDTESLSLPTHVRELDIRPETLPDDIGAAALALWQRGEALAAMSLLYRGALSQLVHRHAVPIRASSTEGDCLRLARPRLGDGANGYLEALVGAWRQTVYADRPPADATAEALCAGFASQFAPPSAPAAA